MAVGLLLAAPALIALLIGYVWPTGRTIAWSLQERDPFGQGGEFVGFDNYTLLAGEFFGSLPFTLGLATLPLLALLLVGSLLALAAHHAGKPIRLTVRVVIGVLMVCFTPVALAIAWLVERVVQDLLVDPDLVGAPLGVWLASGLGLFGFAVAIGTTLFLAVLRGREPGRSAWPAGLVVSGLAVAATIAISLQAFTYPYLMTRGGPLRTTATPMLDAFEYGFVRFDFGAGAAMATLALLLVMLLGVGAALLVILSGLRTEWVPANPAKASVPAAIVALLGVVVVLVVAVVGLWPWLQGLGRVTTDVDLGGVSLEGPSPVELVVRTWVPTALSTALGVGLAALAGFGIGGLRPVGRWSELLLLPFAPWLFVGVGPLFLAQWTAAEDEPIQRVDTFLGLVPPVWLVVPALFAFTLLFRGLARQATEPSAGARYSRMLVRALPMLAVVGATTWLVQSQGLLWPLGVSLDPEHHPASVWLVQQLSQYALQPGSIALGLAYPIPMIVIFAVGAVLLQLFYLDRLAIRVGREPESPSAAPPPRPGPVPQAHLGR